MTSGARYFPLVERRVILPKRSSVMSTALPIYKDLIRMWRTLKRRNYSRDISGSTPLKWAFALGKCTKFPLPGS